MRQPIDLRRRGQRLVAAFALAVLVLSASGCATWNAQFQAQREAGLPPKAELAETPFYPDDTSLCGPAALATSLTAAGFPVRPEQLNDEVFLPGRGGTLQIEMLAAARRHGAVATVIPGTPEALMREIVAGHPVVVLQNLGLSIAPAWHYAVAVGYDLDAGHVVLRSGPFKRDETGFRTFGYTWNRSERWAFVTLPPGKLPATATEKEVTRALVAYERNAKPADAISAYRSGLRQWPDNATLGLGLGNALYASGDKVAAEAAFRRVAETSHLAAAYNNQARVLLELGRRTEARQAAERGLAVAGPMRQTLLDTLAATGSGAGR